MDDHADLPTVSFPRLWHVGTLRLADKRRGSYEGACLSVSRCPAAWREIGEGLVSGPCHVADASDVVMIDALSLDADRKDAVMAWGVAQGYCRVDDLWVLTTTDEEGDERTSTFASEEEARDEIDEDFDDGATVHAVREHRSTEALQSLVMSDAPLLGDLGVLEMLLPLWTDAATPFAGVWWDEAYDPLSFSAPRGALIAGRLDLAAWRPTDDEPYDLDDAADGETGLEEAA